MATSIDQREFVKTALRLPPALHAAVHASAKKTGRSYNAELIALLEAGLNPTQGDPLSNPQRERLEASIQATRNHAELIAIRLALLDSRIEGLEVGKGNIEREAAMFERTGAPEFEYPAKNVGDLVGQLESQKQKLMTERADLLQSKQELDGEIATAKRALEAEAEARYRFLEAKGAKGVRQAKV